MGEILSLGFIGGSIKSAVGNTHKIACQMDNRWKLEAGCFSKDEKTNYETAEIYGVNKKRVYKEWQMFLNSEKGKLDAVCILTPTNIHYEMLTYALKLGYAVICEKSMVANYNEAKKVCKIVEENNSFLAVTYNYTGYPMIRELKAMIDENKLGKINQIIIEMPQEGFIKLDKYGSIITPQEWRLKDGEVTTISLDLGVHLHNMIHFLSGERPISLIADETTFGNFEQVVDNVLCIAKYTGNITSQIWYSKSSLGNRNGLKIKVFGNKGSATWIQMKPEELTYYDVHGNSRIMDRGCNVYVADKLRYNRFKAGHPAGFIEAFANYYYDIAESLIEYKEHGTFKSDFIFNGFQAMEGLQMVEAISKSSKQRKWIDIK